MKRRLAFLAVASVLLLGIGAGAMWYANFLFLRAMPQFVRVGDVDSSESKVFMSRNGDVLVFVRGKNGKDGTYLASNADTTIAMTSRLHWSFESPLFVFAPDQVSGSVVAGQFGAKLAGEIIEFSPKELIFRVDNLRVEVKF